MSTELPPSTTSLKPPLIPKGRIGRFIYESEIGQGSIGIVCLFRDPMIGRLVAIKVLNPQLPVNQRQLFEKHFIQEARAAGRLNHPNIVTVYDADKYGDLLYIAMEYLQGQELSYHIAKKHAFSYKHIAEIISKIASALDYAHENGVIHRDIKPANIFITEKGNPKVLDFGIASASRQMTDTEATLGLEQIPTRRLMGTPNYMSPEQARSEKIDARTDIYSLGVVLYQLLCGQLPFSGNNVDELLQAIIKNHAVPPHEIKSDVPLRLAKIAAKALAKKPSDRYQRASEMAKDLNRYLEMERTQRIIAKIQSPEDKSEHTLDPNDTHNIIRSSLFQKFTQSPRFKISIISGISLLFIIFITGLYFSLSKTKAPEPSLNLVKNNEVAPIKPATALPTTKSVEAISAQEKIDTNVANKIEIDSKTSVPITKKIKQAKSVEQQKVEVSPPALGIVNIAISPWGEVFVDGQAKGVTPPLTKLKLSVGKHKIEIKNGEENHVVNLEIFADKEAKINHRFQ